MVSLQFCGGGEGGFTSFLWLGVCVGVVVFLLVFMAGVGGSFTKQ